MTPRRRAHRRTRRTTPTTRGGEARARAPARPRPAPSSAGGDARLEAAVEPEPRGRIERGHGRRLLGARGGRLLHQRRQAGRGGEPRVSEMGGGGAGEDEGIHPAALEELRGALEPRQIGRQLRAARGLRVRERGKPEPFRAPKRGQVAALRNPPATNKTHPQLAYHHTSLVLGRAARGLREKLPREILPYDVAWGVPARRPALGVGAPAAAVARLGTQRAAIPHKGQRRIRSTRPGRRLRSVGLASDP